MPIENRICIFKIAPTVATPRPRRWTTLKLTLVCLLLGVLWATTARAEHAVMWLDTGGEAPGRAVLLDTVIDIHVLGMMTFAEVRQRYVNDTDAWAEARFVFPLPDQAAVDTLAIRVGERLIDGEIQERAQARATYQQARAEGRHAGLVEQVRANLFTTSVANIGPGEEIEVRIGFQQTVSYSDGRFSLRFPTTFVPHFVPGQSLPQSIPGADIHSTQAADTEQVSGTSLVGAPAQHAVASGAHPIQIQATLYAGFELAGIHSLHHAIWQQRDKDVWRVGLENGVVASDRDFELVWTPHDAAHAQSAVYRERVGDTDYVLAMLVPPHRFRADHTPREVTLIVDTSGSMRGAPMAQARDALQVALAAFTPRDRFNLIEFNSTTRALFPAPMGADAITLAQAARFVGALQANGGTVMAPALTQALDAQTPPGYLRQMVFITDGAVGNDQELWTLIQRNIGAARLFTVGIGHGVNDHFLRKAADLGRGSYTFIAHQQHIEERMVELLMRLTSPVLHDIELAWPTAVEVFPQRIPDLYVGEPLLVLARLPATMGEVQVVGLSDGQRWRRTLSLQHAVAAPGVAKLWARRRIEALLDTRGEGADPEEVRAEATATAVQYQVLSPYTSLVAVEQVPARPTHEPLMPHTLAQSPVHGRQSHGVIGVGGGRTMPNTATVAWTHLRTGILWLAFAAWLMLGWRGTGAADAGR